MANLKQTIKSNIVSTNNKFNSSSERIATVVSVNDGGTYNISVISSDGIKSIYENVEFRLDGSFDSITIKEPSINDQVYVKQDGSRFVITGIYKKTQNISTPYDEFCDWINGILGGLIN